MFLTAVSEQILRFDLKRHLFTLRQFSIQEPMQAVRPT